MHLTVAACGQVFCLTIKIIKKMKTEQIYEQINDIHTMLAKLPIETTVYQIMSDKLIRIKDALAKNLPQADVIKSVCQCTEEFDVKEVSRNPLVYKCTECGQTVL